MLIFALFVPEKIDTGSGLLEHTQPHLRPMAGIIRETVSGASHLIQTLTACGPSCPIFLPAWRMFISTVPDWRALLFDRPHR
jgi:hypothetical protein